MIVFVTVGSFEFNVLIQTVLSDPTLFALRSRGYNKLVVQCGNSHFDMEDSIGHDVERHGVLIQLWKFKPSLQADLKSADMVIGHAGEDQRFQTC